MSPKTLVIESLEAQFLAALSPDTRTSQIQRSAHTEPHHESRGGHNAPQTPHHPAAANRNQQARVTQKKARPIGYVRPPASSVLPPFTPTPAHLSSVVGRSRLLQPPSTTQRTQSWIRDSGPGPEQSTVAGSKPPDQPLAVQTLSPLADHESALRELPLPRACPHGRLSRFRRRRGNARQPDQPHELSPRRQRLHQEEAKHAWRREQPWQRC